MSRQCLFAAFVWMPVCNEEAERQRKQRQTEREDADVNLRTPSRRQTFFPQRGHNCWQREKGARRHQ